MQCQTFDHCAKIWTMFADEPLQGESAAVDDVEMEMENRVYSEEIVDDSIFDEQVDVEVQGDDIELEDDEKLEDEL